MRCRGSCWGGVGHTGVGWGESCSKTTLKNDSPQNQDLTSPKSFLEGVQNLNFEYKKIIILLLQLCYIPNYIKKIINRCSLYKNLNGMIITLVPTDKSRKVTCVLNGTENAFYQSNYQKEHALSHIIQKAVDNNFSKQKTEHLTCDRSNYSMKFFTAHSTPV